MEVMEVTQKLKVADAVEVAESSKKIQITVDKPVWLKALTLDELVSLLRSYPNITLNGKNAEKAQRRLEKWKKQAPFSLEPYFTDRLAMEGLTEQEILVALGEPFEELQNNLMATSPEWLTTLAQAYCDYPVPPIQLAAETQLLDTSMLLNALTPLAQKGITRLELGLAQLIDQRPNVPFETNRVLGSILGQLSALFFPKAGRTLTLELNVARIQGCLKGGTPAARFESFVRYLCEQGGIVTILEEYPLLARRLLIIIDRWADYNLEILRHFCDDLEKLKATFALDAADKLVEITGQAGDTHRGGRSVALLKFESGFQLVYKPKSMAIDLHVQELLLWLNKRGTHPDFRAIKILDCGNYGWSEFVSVQPCSSETELERFYERQGGYLALMYALNASDFHKENLIAAGEQPILIDLESMFQGTRKQSESQPNTQSNFWKKMYESVLRIGMLPSRNDATFGSVDMSGLGGQPGQLTPNPVPVWDNLATDELQLVKKRMEIKVSDNRPSLKGQDINTTLYLNNIISGFTKVYELLMQHKAELIAEHLDVFANDEVRLVVRPTMLYGDLLEESFHPDILRNALDCNRLFDHLWQAVVHMPDLAKLIESEQADLFAGDIPMFTTHPNSHILYDSKGQAIPNFFEKTGLELVRERIDQLSESDLARQIWYIKASFTSMFMGDDTASWVRPDYQEATGKTDRDRLIKEATLIGDRLCDLALHDKAEVGWIGVTLIGENNWVLQPTTPNMYDGTSGITLFLAYLGKITGNAKYTDTARKALESLQKKTKSSDFDIATIEERGLNNAVSDLGDLIYLYSHLGSLWNEPALFEAARELVAIIDRFVEFDISFDIISGSAGRLAHLFSLYAVAPSEDILVTAIKLGDHLLKHLQPTTKGSGWLVPKFSEQPLTGFSHGVAGVAMVLLKLAALTSEERFREAAFSAIEYERSVFSEAAQNWPDFRIPEDPEEAKQRREKSSYQATWCHGAPGIALGRLFSLQYLDDSQIRREIEVAINTTLRQGFGLNHSLCHGDLGNLDIILVASQIFEDATLKETIDRITGQIVETIGRQGWLTGIPLSVEVPGLLTGLAGIGYELLRLAEPILVPSVLALATPHIG